MILVKKVTSKKLSLPALLPDNAAAAGKMAKVPDGTILEITIGARQTKTLGLYWMLINFFAHNLPEAWGMPRMATGDALAQLVHKAVLLRVGWADPVSVLGEMYLVPRETRFIKLKNDDIFREQVLRPAIALICAEMKMTEDELMNAAGQHKAEVGE